MLSTRFLSTTKIFAFFAGLFSFILLFSCRFFTLSPSLALVIFRLHLIRVFTCNSFKFADLLSWMACTHTRSTSFFIPFHCLTLLPISVIIAAFFKLSSLFYHSHCEWIFADDCIWKIAKLVVLRWISCVAVCQRNEIEKRSSHRNVRIDHHSKQMHGLVKGNRSLFHRVSVCDWVRTKM